MFGSGQEPNTVRPASRVPIPQNKPSWMGNSTILSLEGARSDLRRLQASGLDLSASLPPLETGASANTDIQRSYEYVKNAHQILRISADGGVDEVVREPDGYMT